MQSTTFAVAILASTVLTTSMLACSETSEPSSGTDESSITQGGDDDVFAKPDALAVKVSAPLSTLFARYKEKQFGTPGSTFTYEDSEPGRLVFTHGGEAKSLDLRVYIRPSSNTTRGYPTANDCPFPKLTIEFTNKSQLQNTPFNGHTTMLLNTHCGSGDVNTRSLMGRVRNGVGPVREDLTFRLIRAAGFPAFRTRVVAVHYDDTADATQLDSFGMFIESPDDAAQRFAEMDPPLIAPDWEHLDHHRVDTTPENAAQIVIAETLAGNSNWRLDAYHGESTGPNTRNIVTLGKCGIRQSDGRCIRGGVVGLQLPHEFDVSRITLGGDMVLDARVYWHTFGSGPQMSKAIWGLNKSTAVAEALRPRKAAMESAYREAEAAMIAAHAIATEDGKTTTDPGFLEAKDRIKQLFDLFELPEFKAPPGDRGAD